MEDLKLLDLTSLKSVMPPNVGDVGDFLDINVTLAASPSNFTVSLETVRTVRVQTLMI